MVRKRQRQQAPSLGGGKMVARCGPLGENIADWAENSQCGPRRPLEYHISMCKLLADLVVVEALALVGVPRVLRDMSSFILLLAVRWLLSASGRCLLVATFHTDGSRHIWRL